MNWRPRVFMILSAIGIVVASYLVLKTNDPSSVACSIGGGCEKVLSSQYARIFGISVATLGVAWYIGTLILSWIVYVRRQWTPILFQLWTAGGLAFSLYLLYISKFKVGAFCTWCLSSLVVVALLFGLSLVKTKSDVE